MATSLDTIEVEDIQRYSTDEALKCPLCLNTYETPRALACLHTFCEPCLGFYIADTKASLKDGKLERIECPVCSHPTVPPDTLKHPHAMVKDFPLNHFILPHLKTVTPRGRDSRTEQRRRSVNFTQCCGSCTDRGVTVEATAYCQDCEDFLCGECVGNHSKIKMLSKHKIVEIDRVTSGSRMASAFDKHYICLHHQMQDIRFYCTNHDVLLCSDCVVESHKACEILGEFDDLGLKLKQGDEPQKLHDNMKGLQKALTDMVKAIRANNYGIKRETEEIPKRIKSMKAKVIRLFQYLEETAEKSIQEFQEEHGNVNSDKAFRCKQLLAAIEGTDVSLDSVLEHGSHTQMFLTFHKTKAQLQDYDDLVKTEKDSLICTSIQMKMEDALEVIVNETDKLGEVFVETTKPDLGEMPPLLFVRRETSVDDMKPEFLKSEQLKSPADTNIQRECVAATYMDKKLALVFEVKNRTWFSYTLSLINAENMNEMHTLDLKRDPKSVICIDDNNFAVTFPNGGCIEFYLYTPKRRKKPMKIDLDHTVKCDIRDTVISRFSKRDFAISTRNHFGTMSHDGVMTRLFYYSVSLRVRETDFWSTQLIVEHVVVDSRKNRIYVASSKPYKVYSFNTNGEVMFDYSFDRPITCLDLDKDGNICVCHGEDSAANLSQLSPNTGKLLRVVAIETKCPKLSCFNRKGGDFYLLETDKSKTVIDKYRFNVNVDENLFIDD